MNLTTATSEVVPQREAIDPGTADQFKPWRFSVRAMLIFVAVIGVLLAIPIYITNEVERVREGVANHYALTEVTEMMAHHFLRRGRLPGQWDDMRDDYAFVDQSYGLGSTGFDELQRRVTINFDLLSGSEQVGESDWIIRVRRERKSEIIRDAEQRANERLKRLELRNRKRSGIEKERFGS